MIKSEIIGKRRDGTELCKTYSTDGFKIKQVETDRVFDEAIDTVPCKFTYEETDIIIEPVIIEGENNVF